MKNLSTPYADITSFLDSVPPAQKTAAAYNVHVALDGLQPGTTYYYTLGQSGLGSGPWSSSLTGTFTRAPETSTALQLHCLWWPGVRGERQRRLLGGDVRQRGRGTTTSENGTWSRVSLYGLLLTGGAGDPAGGFGANNALS